MAGDPRTAFCRRLGYRFKNPALLDEALRHSSFVNEQGALDLRDNERLEFLGDAVLSLVIGSMLMARYPQSPEGQLSRMRAALVNEKELARLADGIGIGEHLKLGKGEDQDGGRGKPSILADAFEALVAAVFLDGGFGAARRVVQKHFAAPLEQVGTPEGERDPKSRLQELIQSTRHTVPRYRLLASTGPDHDKTFQVELRLDNLVTLGTGKSKKAAEQDAARRALARLSADDSP
ncbi:MAG TPA: ribonuclease III [Desulfobacteraceae bacterium]|nr:ribonuclease III [Deltaproteobacteria bacterium]MBW2355776.1 ribonuclease III [Deltaproteobacteria bacterium]RLB98424.1 MAG: ribonuclease III [Deltaproteobacteria bacterium]HDI58905.1 ribonuclease III [Desulfobacteraceae bacterium]